MREVEVTIEGRHLRITDDDVRARLRRVEPEAPFKWVVDIDGVVFPVKQAFAVATGLERLDFGTDRAKRVFERLGFLVQRQGAGGF